MYQMKMNIYKQLFILFIGLETHGGPGAIGPRIFQMAPHFLRPGAHRVPQIFEPPTYIYIFEPPDFGLGPHVFRSRGPKGPREKNRVSSPVLLFNPSAINVYFMPDITSMNFASQVNL